MSDRAYPIQPADVGFGVLFDSSRDAVVVADAARGRIVLWNPAAETLLGYTCEEAVGMPLERLVPDELRSAHRTGVARYAETGTGELIDSPDPLELPALCKDGRRIEIELMLSPLRSEDRGAGPLVMATLRDVSTRARLARELQEANEQLSDALANEREAVQRLQDISDLKSESVAMVAHDLKSPLTSIAQLTAILRSSWDRMDEARRDDVLQRIESNVERQLHLIDEVLQVEKLELGHVEYDAAPVDLAQMAMEVAEEVNHGATPRVVVHASARTPLGIGDRRRYRQILVNLVSNALKFSPAGSPVEIVVGSEAAFVRVDVADRGVGIDPADMKRLFTKFTRFGEAGDRPSGTGLGLYICKRMVEDQGGRIWATSRAGEGTTFTFTVPLHQTGK